MELSKNREDALWAAAFIYHLDRTRDYKRAREEKIQIANGLAHGTVYDFKNCPDRIQTTTER